MLARKVFLASAVLSGGRLAIRFLDLIAALLVARFLTPAEFGLVSLAIALLMTLRALTELPVSEALVRGEDLTRDDIDTAFTLSLLRGLTVAAYPVEGPRDVVGPEVPGGTAVAVLDEDLKKACLGALALARTPASLTPRAFAESHSWRACTLQFLQNIVVEPDPPTAGPEAG